MCAFYDINFGWMFDRDCGDEMRKTIDDFILGNDCYVNLNDYPYDSPANQQIRR